MPRLQQRKPKKSQHIKTPVVPPVSYDSMKPLFSFEYLSEDCCSRQCDHAEVSGFADTLRIMGKMTWLELINAPKHGNGKENIPIDQVKAARPEIATDDVRHYYAFRFHDKKPMIGLRVDRTFHVLWLDRTHSLYTRH